MLTLERGAPDVAVRPAVIALGAIENLDVEPVAVFLCSGVIIDERTVATAAHCVAGDEYRDFSVIVGSTDLCTEDGWQSSIVRSIDVPRAEADLALLRLSDPISTEPTQTVKLQGDYVLAGWQQPDRLAIPHCSLHVAQAVDCNDFGPYFECATVGGTCSGMSGAGSYAETEVVAVVSSSNSCGSDGDSILAKFLGQG